MKAIVQDEYGSADVLELREIDRPEIGDDEVLIRVHSAGVHRGVWHIMTGLPYPIRVAGFGLRAPKTPVPGTDMAGVVELVGPAVTRFQPGDEVFGIATGAFAEFARAGEDKLVLKPAALSFEQAAAIPTSATTALQALRNQGRVEPGDNVLIVGASGGVGMFAVQIAKSLGAEVTGVCSTSKVDMVRSLGADHVIDYNQDDFSASEHRYDVILDIGGNSPLPNLRRALTPKGTLVMVGGETDGRWLGGMDRQLKARVTFPFMGQKLGTFVAKVNLDDLIVVTDLVEAGKVTPFIDRTFALGESSDAIRYLEDGLVVGKVAITV